MSVSSVATVVAGALTAVVGLAGTLYASDSASQYMRNGASSNHAAVSPPPKARSFIVVNGGRTSSPRASAPMSAPSPASTAAAPGMCALLERQRDVEVALSALTEYKMVVVDGRQSPGDCAIIRRFQQRFGIQPANGQADATTADVGQRIAVASTAARQRQCDAGRGVTACVDLSSQTAWVVRDGLVVVGPTVVRSGFRGYATPAGEFQINKRELREWSDPYGVWLPYWQRFIGGIGFHETTTYIHDGSTGSHGCVNLLQVDAVAMWEQMLMGTTVRAFGRRPGT